MGCFAVRLLITLLQVLYERILALESTGFAESQQSVCTISLPMKT